jgi:hypothetical protein
MVIQCGLVGKLKGTKVALDSRLKLKAQVTVSGLPCETGVQVFEVSYGPGHTPLLKKRPQPKDVD